MLNVIVLISSCSLHVFRYHPGYIFPDREMCTAWMPNCRPMRSAKRMWIQRIKAEQDVATSSWTPNGLLRHLHCVLSRWMHFGILECKRDCS
jgi:hypothetical protein